MQEARRLGDTDLGLNLEPLAETHSERLEAQRGEAREMALQFQRRQKRLSTT